MLIALLGSFADMCRAAKIWVIWRVCSSWGWTRPCSASSFSSHTANKYPLCVSFNPLFLLLYFCAFCCWFPFTRSPGWEAWHQAQNLHNSGRTSLALLFSGFVGHPPGRYGIWFYRDCTPPTISLGLLCLWMWSIFFWWVLASSCQWLFSS